MRNSLADVVAAALRVLDEQGLEGCSMRRVAVALEVQPSALYHHVPNKQTLLALMADEIVGGVDGRDPRLVCTRLRDAMLAVRDGADVVATAAAFRLGTSGIERRLAELVGADGARTLLLYTFGHAQSTQTHRQAAAFGALVDTAPGPGAPAAAGAGGPAAAGAGASAHPGSGSQMRSAGGAEPGISDPDPAGDPESAGDPDSAGDPVRAGGLDPAGDPAPAGGLDPAGDLDASFERGLGIILAGLDAEGLSRWRA